MSQREQGVKNQLKGTSLLISSAPFKQLWLLCRNLVAFGCLGAGPLHQKNFNDKVLELD